MLCSVVKHAGSGRVRKKCRGKNETQSSVFPHFLSALPLPKCFTTEHSTRKPISHESRSDECDIGFQVQFNAEFTSQVMNFP